MLPKDDRIQWGVGENSGGPNSASSNFLFQMFVPQLIISPFSSSLTIPGVAPLLRILCSGRAGRVKSNSSGQQRSQQRAVGSIPYAVSQ